MPPFQLKRRHRALCHYYLLLSCNIHLAGPQQGRARKAPHLAALSDTTILPGGAGGSISAPRSTVEPRQTHATAAAEAVAPAIAIVPSVRATADSDEGNAAGGAAYSLLPSAYSSFEDLDALEPSGSELDSDEPDMCTLVADPSGDVQVVCESDPTHPLSLAEAAVYSPPLPPTLLQDIEAKLEGDLITIAVTIIFAVGFISLEFGVNDLIEHYFGDSLLSDVVCVWVGLAVVFWVKLSKARLMRFDRWR
ncbi:hypothetical protein Vretimale_4594 [Volvox reticuliferus]|uniref:Uncharacterized protein n=1 Tax=Volvox reticuliferus TaxID=1737510 RepID=A0A8J4FJ60_9CHLO|nr:hypothetical protein Vretifemale_3189 [Volvox reticuliferus]GIL99430.1 hypothetical protein Vretimale_4594 [Volvox reticuliferus]